MRITQYRCKRPWAEQKTVKWTAAVTPDLNLSDLSLVSGSGFKQHLKQHG